MITGATGTIGAAVCQALVARGDEVVALVRAPARAREMLGSGVEVSEWAEPSAGPPPEAALSGADAVIHLLGEPVAQRWSDEAKDRIRDSRVLGTRMLVQALRGLPPERRPDTLVSGSAIGYYGPSDDSELTEASPPGNDFLASVVTDWEAEAHAAEDVLRVTVIRTGVVLSSSGGALAQMLPFFRAGVGGPVAGGRQYVPWVHLDDVVGAVLFFLDRHDLSGPVNVTAPEPVTNAELSRALGRALHRPALLPVPGLALRALYGEMAQIVITGQRARPARLLELGFAFRHPELEPALRDVLARG
ncbi:MAG: TIGR01777 family oxidoreductase [Solirubrobacteraceae bacterium]